jgi:hypothetical protein
MKNKNENDNENEYENEIDNTPNKIEEDDITLNRCRNTMHKIVNNTDNLCAIDSGMYICICICIQIRSEVYI